MGSAKTATKELYLNIILTIFESVNENSASNLMMKILSTFSDEQKIKISKELPSPSSDVLRRLKQQVLNLQMQILEFKKELLGHDRGESKGKIESEFGSCSDSDDKHEESF